MRWAALFLGGLVACGGGEGGSGGAGAGSTSAGACESGATYLCNCSDSRPGHRICLPDGQGWGACDCGPAGSGGAGQGGAGGGQGGQGGSGGAVVPECQTAADCEDERLACGETCVAGCTGGGQGGVCVITGPYECNQANPCPQPPICNTVECVFDNVNYTSSCVVSPVPDGTPCTPGGMALCEGGMCP